MHGVSIIFGPVTEFSGGVDPAGPVVVAAPEAPPVVQKPTEARPLGRCCSVEVPPQLCLLSMYY